MSEIFKKLHNKKLSSRAKVILIIEEILQGQSLSSLLDVLLESVDDADRGFVHQLLLGTLRQWWALTRINESLIEKMPTDQGLFAALNVGLYQLLYMNTPDYAVINDTVQAVKSLDKDYGAGLVNAILRKVAKANTKYAKKVSKNHSLPNWLAKQLKQDWPDVYDALGLALRAPASIFIRVNPQKCSVTDYSALLTKQGIAHSVVELGASDAQSIRLDAPIKVAELPHFADGYITVQDLHAQLSAWLLMDDMPADAVVLDMCCAPGGKTTHLLEMFHMKQLVSIDNDVKRLQRVQQNLERLGLADKSVQVITADGTAWQSSDVGIDGFDVIVLDAPCTATGVIRRHPDIALLRQEADVASTVALQAKILDNAWKNLKTGGVLLYVTCSLLKAENETQMLNFVNRHPDAKVLPLTLSLDNQFAQQIGYQCLPLDAGGGDGFYYAKLQKGVTPS